MPVALFLGLLLFAGCTPQEILVVSDPYFDALGAWLPTTPSFVLRSRLSGMRITHVTIDEEKPMSELLAEVKADPDILILSPWNRYESLLPGLEEKRIIILGGLPPTGAGDKVSGLVADYSLALMEVGRMAGEFASEADRPALLLTDRNVDSLREAYREIAGEAHPLIEVAVDRSGDGEPVPENFLSQMEDSSVLLLFAGPMNLTAYHASADIGLPIITESALGEGRWDERIIASIEDDRRAMASILLKLMKKNYKESIVYYPSRLENQEKWFDAPILSNL